MSRQNRSKHQSVLTVFSAQDLLDSAHTCLRCALYHYDSLRVLLQTRALSTPWQHDMGLTAEQKHDYATQIDWFHAHLGAFFWELVAAFDSASAWAKKGGQQRSMQKQLLEAARDSDWYFEIKEYRNFSHQTHHLVTTMMDSYPKLGQDQEQPMVFLSKARKGQRIENLPDQLARYDTRMTELINKITNPGIFITNNGLLRDQRERLQVV